MEEKINVTNSGFYSHHTNKNKLFDTRPKKSGIKKYNSKTNSKKYEKNNISPFNDNKQRQIKQCFLDLVKTKELKEKKIKEEIKSISIKGKEEKQKQSLNKNKSELKGNKTDNKNIKVNKIKIEKINIENIINSNSMTNRDFYQKTSERNNKCDMEQNKMKTYMSDFYNKKNKNMRTVKSFNKNNLEGELLNNEFRNSEFINYMIPYNNNTFIYDNLKHNNRYNLNTNTYSNTTAGKSKESNNSSKILISYKIIKTFYAHLEIFICLYLKRIFKFFIEKIKNYEMPKNIINNNSEFLNTDGAEGNNYRPIVNVNNAHCSLYCSINLNQDKLFNTLFENQNLCSFTNNTFTPLTKRNDIQNIKQMNKNDLLNNNKRNRLLLINPGYDINLSNINKRIEKTNNKSVYIPKKKISKGNQDCLKGISSVKNINNKKSPIKEMNINLKQINVCRLNDLNQFYSTQNLYKSNTNNFNYSKINPIIKIPNNEMNHTKYNSSNIFSFSHNNSNISKEKNKLKKIQSAKYGIYMKPKDKTKKKKIKEIKIQSRLSPLISEKEKNGKINMKSENILTMFNGINKNKYLNDNSKISDVNLNTINNSKDVNPIKKIYIKRSSKQKNSNLNIFNLRENLFDTYKKQFYSTFLDFKSAKRLDNDEILIKQITTSDKRIFISIKYVNLENNFHKNKKNNILTILNLKVDNQYSISIINNKLEINNNIYDLNLNKFKNIKMMDIYSFDNDKNGGKCGGIIKFKNISFSFKEYSPSKEESHDNNNEHFINFIIKLKDIIIKSIRKYIFIRYKKIKCLKKLIKNKKNKIMNNYFLIFKNKANKIQIKIDKNNCGIYHKINYNDDFNLTKKLKSPKNSQKTDACSAHCKIKAYNLTTHNSINQINNKKKLSNKKTMNYKRTDKLINKEINIIVHSDKNNSNKNNITNNNIALNKLKNKFFLMRIKLIKNVLKMIKNEL